MNMPHIGMSRTGRIFIKLLAIPFYRQHAGLFTFLVFIMVFCVGNVDSGALLDYHYSLIQGMLTSQPFLFAILVAWSLYALHCIQYVARTIRRPDYQVLGVLAQVSFPRLFGMSMVLQVILFAPVLIYVLIMVAVGLYHHWYGPLAELLGFCGLVCLAGATRHVYILKNPGKNAGKNPGLLSVFSPGRWSIFYGMFLIRYVLERRKMLFLAIKLYDCFFLYMMVVHQVPVDYDLRMIWLFYSFGLLGHGVLVHQIRELEETRLGFYRGLPVTMAQRFLQYVWVYLLLFAPEVGTIAYLTPGYLHYPDALLLAGFGFGLLLFLHGLLFAGHYKMATYLKILTLVFFVIFIAVVSRTIFFLVILVFFLSAVLFYRHYYRYERELLPASCEG
jgi:hypothetical protein